ncbi:MAG TPA: hypothetical protein VG206_23360 [Terriglobia bacterium]|nr:hypothetical protein [Terriglobia bacterium]
MTIALLGKRDSPTDAVEDYCQLLSRAFDKRGVASVLVRVPWDEAGWARAVRDLWRKSAHRKGHWVLVQYTALMWSRRGFPLRFLIVLALLKIRKARLAVVFHDPEPYAGRRPVDRLRRACQRFVMRGSYRAADASILCVPLESVSWLPRNPAKASFIPVGANIPAIRGTGVPPVNGHGQDGHTTGRTIAVFGITGDGDIGNEVPDIAFVAKTVAEGFNRLQLVTLGRGSAESEGRFRKALNGSRVEYNSLGVLPAEGVSRILAASDVALFVRGCASTQRGSAIASIACALPLVAYADSSLAAPLAEAGVVPVPCGDRESLAQAALRVLTDGPFWLDLHQRSERAHQRYFSWEAVAGRFTELLDDAQENHA